jgi:hypothetical protein
MGRFLTSAEIDDTEAEVAAEAAAEWARIVEEDPTVADNS